MLTYVLLLAGPWLVRRLLEPRVGPRALVWTYLASMVAASGATFLLLLALLLRYLPHDYLTKAGLVCKVKTACQRTLPLWANATFSFLLGGVLLGLTLFAVFVFFSQLSSTGRRGNGLLQSVLDPAVPLAPRLDGRVLLLEDPRPLSYTIGFLRPSVVVSTGLLDTLDDGEIEAVLAHEEGHVVALDNLLLLVARTVSLTFVLVPGVRPAYRRLRRAQEIAADEFARRRTGDGLVVASSLQKFARSLFGPGPNLEGALAFADEGDVTERIRGLLFGRVVVTSKRHLAGAVLVLVVLFGVFAGSALVFTDVGFARPGKPESTCHQHAHAAQQRVSATPAPSLASSSAPAGHDVVAALWP